MSRTFRITIRIVAAVLIAAFFVQDILWANPEMFEYRQSAPTLQIPSFFQNIDPARILEVNLRRLLATEYSPTTSQRLVVQDRGVYMELALPPDAEGNIPCAVIIDGIKHLFIARVLPDKSIRLVSESGNAEHAAQQFEPERREAELKRPVVEEDINLTARSENEADKIRRSVEIVRGFDKETRVAFVVPMYKEMDRLRPRTLDNPLGEDAVRKKVAQLIKLSLANPLFTWRLVFVDDGTPDGACGGCVDALWKEVRDEYMVMSIELDKDQVKTIVMTPQQKLELRSAKGAAVHMGFEYTIQEGWADYVGYTDTDLSTNLAQTGLLLEALGEDGVGVAVGSRWCEGAESGNVPFSGIISSRIYNWCVRILMPPLREIPGIQKAVLDTQRGFKLFKRQVIVDIRNDMRDKGWAFDTELLLASRLNGYILKEVPIAWIDSPGASKLNILKHAPQMFWSLVKQRRLMFSNKYNRYSAQLSRRENTKFIFRLGTVLAATVAACAVMSLIYLSGGLGWYPLIKDAASQASFLHIIKAPAVFADIFTGVIICGTCDAIGQYLNKGRDVDFKQSFILGAFGIFQGLGTHILFNSIELLPVLPWPAAQMLFRTGAALIGGLVISLVFARATSMARRSLGADKYSEKKEWGKAGDVVLVKFLLAPIKTFIVINILPPPIRVFAEQAWDYFMTIIAASLMNREEPILVGRLDAVTSKIRNILAVTRKSSGDVLPGSNQPSRVESGTGPIDRVLDKESSADIAESRGTKSASPQPIVFLRNIVDTKELTQNMIEGILSALFSNKKLTLAFSRKLSGLESGQLRLLARQLNGWKESTVRKNKKMKALLDNFTVFEYDDLKQALDERGIDVNDRDGLVLAYAPKPKNESENASSLGSAIKPVFIIEQEGSFPLNYYYPLLEMVTISLAKELLQWDEEQLKEALALSNITIDNFGIDAAIDARSMALIFRVLPRMERYDNNSRINRYARLLQFLRAA